MEISFTSVVLLLVLSLLAASNNAQTQNCSTYAFSNGRSFANCNNLPALNSFLHWNYHQNNHTVDIAYRHTQITSTNWVAWALNPSSTGMIGAQSLVAFVGADGTVRAHTAPITSYSPSLEEAPLSFPVSSTSADFVDDNQIIIYATIQLPAGATSFAHVWQHGDVSGGSPRQHPTSGDHMRSVGNIDFASAAAATPTPTPTPAPPTSSTPPTTNATTTTTNANNCPSYSFSNGRTYSGCNSLPVLGAFLHWNYQGSNNSIDIAYRHTGVSPSNWVAWALNPTGNNMIGAQSLVAVVGSSGSVRAYTSPVTSYSTSLQEGPLSFGVPSISAEFVEGSQVIIYANLQLPAGGTTSFTQVWQHGPVTTGGAPQQHATTGDNVRSIGSIDFATGATTNGGGGGGGGSRQRRRNVHGVLNVVSWGILMPLGVLVARYLKVFKSANPAWFYLHVSCQTSAYIVGVAGWATGIKLGSDSPGVQYNLHRNIGIALFALGTLQLFALLLRPKPDHKFRFYWNIYHHLTGYTVIILTIVNIFEGFDILDPQKKWKNAYIGVLISLGASAALLEAFTWFIVLNRKRESHKNPQQPITNGVNGYHA